MAIFTFKMRNVLKLMKNRFSDFYFLRSDLFCSQNSYWIGDSSTVCEPDANPSGARPACGAPTIFFSSDFDEQFFGNVSGDFKPEKKCHTFFLFIKFIFCLKSTETYANKFGWLLRRGDGAGLHIVSWPYLIK